jgi:hypothetical protein
MILLPVAPSSGFLGVDEQTVEGHPPGGELLFESGPLQRLDGAD